MRFEKLSILLCAVPLLGVVELALHVAQMSDVVPDDDWKAAADAVKADFHAGGSSGPSSGGDLVLFAPFWSDPLGREFFGDDLTGIKREARPDETRYRRVFEVSIRGAHRDEIAGWKRTAEQHVGKITIGTYENPQPATVLTDLLDRVGPQTLAVARVDKEGEQACPWTRGAGQPGGLSVPQGPAVPGEKFACPGGGYVGVAVLHALDHHPHLCLFASPPGGGGRLRLKFADVTFGESLHGHDGVQWVSERSPSQERVELAFFAAGRPIERHVHRVGVGWVGFELPTPELTGKKTELVVEVSGSSNRNYCFEADTR